MGVCIRANVQPSFTERCSVAALTHAATCLAQLRSCLSGFASSSSTTAGRGDVVSPKCGCYSDVQDCFAERVCSDTIRTLVQQTQASCRSAGVCGALPTLCDSQPLVPNTNLADVTLYVRTHDPYSSADGQGAYKPSYPEPPTSATNAQWISSPFIKVVHLRVW